MFPSKVLYLGALRVPRGFLAVWLLALSSVAFADAKPELKGVYLLYVTPGQSKMVVLYGDNLMPKEAMANKPPMVVKLVEAKATEGDAKGKGNRQVALEISAPANCPMDSYEVVLTNPDGQKVNARVAVVEPVAQEIEVKHPAATYAQAMPIEVKGGTLAVTGALNNDTPDLFRLEAKAGETWSLTVLAGRAGSQLDALLRVRDRKHLSLALSAGDPKRDRQIVFKAPVDGAYYIELTDSEGKGGPTHPYRLMVKRQ